MLSLRFGLIVWAVVGPLIAGGVMLAREKVVVAGAVRAERIEQTAICNSRVAQIETAHNAAVDELTDEAVAAADALDETPDIPADLQALCDRSASCLSRRQP